MNERIKELKEQAFNFVAEQNMTKKEFFWENIRHNRDLQDRVDQKFAELIIKDAAECIANDVRMSMVTAESVAFDMKMRYGVE